MFWLVELAATELLSILLLETGRYALRWATRGSPEATSLSARAWAVRSHTPGRIRLEVSGLRGNWARAEAVEMRLRRLPGVVRADANHRTGRVLVHYDPRGITVARLHQTLAPSAPLAPRWCPTASRRQHWSRPADTSRPQPAERPSHLARALLTATA